MHIETQTKTHKLSSFLAKDSLKKFCTAGFLIALASCSFVELQPGAENIIFAKQGEDCALLETFTAEVKVSTFFLERKAQAIAEELQILAQNKAYSLYANAIWPISEIDNGSQNFEILRCEAL